MNFGEYKQHILTSKQKYLFCVQVQKEPVSSDSRVYPLHSITPVLIALPTNTLRMQSTYMPQNVDAYFVDFSDWITLLQSKAFWQRS